MLPVAILFDGQRSALRDAAQDLLKQFVAHFRVAGIVDDLTSGTIPPDAELAVVLGGDGSILRAAHLMGPRQLPVLGVNLGRLGFLAYLQPEQLAEVLPKIANGKCPVVEHVMLECELLRGGRVQAKQLVLNEVAVLAGAPFAMIDVQLYVDAIPAATYSCDGLIVSTPVGSTAHSLSAGGPILRKDLPAVVISPISPHTLSNRPVVDSAERVFELAIAQPNAGTALLVDGRMLDTVLPDDRIRISQAPTRFRLIDVPGRDYYRTLRDKLGWGGQFTAKSGGTS